MLLAIVALAPAAGCGAPAASQLPAAVESAPQDPARAREVSDGEGEKPGGGEEAATVDWKELERLIEAQQYEAASEMALALAAEARQAGDDVAWARALVRAAQLRTALGGAERTVELLRAEPWPQGEPQRIVLELFTAHALVTYLQTYSWEIAQRERMGEVDEQPVERWTADQIAAEAHRAFAAAWARRGEWEDRSLGALGEHLEQNDYPARIRGTLRDAVSYLWVEALADTSLWRPEHENSTWRLDAGGLAAAPPAPGVGIELTDPAIHPLLKIAAILGDLEAWHDAGGRPEAALEARLERLRRLRAAFDGSAQRVAVESELARILERFPRRWPWWSVAQALRAEWVSEGEAPDALIRARELALAGEGAHPESLGADRCRHLLRRIEAPAFEISAMATDGPGRRSVEVEHRNLARLHFRAYAFDLVTELARGRESPAFGALSRGLGPLAAVAPAAEWSVDLPPTPDYRQHRTFVTPPLSAPGLFLLVASAAKDFRSDSNRLMALPMVVTDLVIVTRDEGRMLEATIRSGATGEVIAGAEVELWQWDWRRPHRLGASRESDGEGLARFDLRRNVAQFLVARHGDEVTFDLERYYGFAASEPDETRAALVYTDRSVYRPGQELAWKVVAYRGRAVDGRYRVLPGASVTVRLIDANGEEVAAETVRSNDFGSASGTFTIPAGRLLGSWRMETSIGGGASVRVEEYKRPTFEVELEEPAAALRLNREARLAGLARYYFGLPVPSGEVAWRVTREPVYPLWWWWRPRRAAVETVAAGEAALGADGRFEIVFVPEADEAEAAEPGVSYRFRLSAEVTDEGGETREASRVFRLGFVAVEASLEAESGFFVAGEPAAVEAVRRDLDGAPRPGAGRWRLLRLAQPAATPLPADLPASPGGGTPGGPPPIPHAAGAADAAPAAGDPYATEGDALSPRWRRDYSAEVVLASWDDAEEVAAGAVEHGEDGAAQIELGPLAAGAYRLRYATDDPFGATFEIAEELVVAGDGRLALPALLDLEATVVEAGATARLLVHSGLEDQEMVLEIFRAGRRLERRRLRADVGPRVIEVPIDSSHRGGLGFTLTCLRDHQLLSVTRTLLVPWSDRELRVELASFRDRLTPGGRETWTVRVAGADESTLAAGSAELLAYMYDRSLDLFAPHTPPRPLAELYPTTAGTRTARSSLGTARIVLHYAEGFGSVPDYPALRDDRLRFLDAYGIGGPGQRHLAMRRVGGPAMPMEALSLDAEAADDRQVTRVTSEAPLLEEKPGAKKIPIPDPTPDEPAPADPGELRRDFAETAFFAPHLLIGDDGTAEIEFEVPDSVTEWSVWVHALTRDLRAGSVERRARSIKDLMVRPYLPRFLREGDRARIRILVQNAGEAELSGTVDLALTDPASGDSLLAAFGVAPEAASGLPFTVAPGAAAELEVELATPSRLGEVAFRVEVRADGLADGELRALPILPGRVHLAGSRFAALQGGERRELAFEPFARAAEDPSFEAEQLVVTVDAQLFYAMLRAVPYLVEYPYECTEQLLNKFLSTGILASLFDRYPAVEAMAAEFAGRDTRFEPWDALDANRKMALEETPWLALSRGGAEEGPAGGGLVKVLDPRIARATRETALAKLLGAQTAEGGFPWWPGGPPSPYMTLYILHGLSRGLEHGIEVPRDPVARAWGYLHDEWTGRLAREARENDCCWELVTFLSYVLSSLPDASWTGGAFTDAERAEMLDFSFRHWRRHSPLLKAQLALALHRNGRTTDAQALLASLMDSSKTTRDEGTFWQPEERSWLWYNDTIEGHAFALTALSEISPDDPRRHGLVHWLFLNRKLGHWKSTRATAEALYAVVRYLEGEELLDRPQAVTVEAAGERRRFAFEPRRFGPLVPHGERLAGTIDPEAEPPGRANQLLLPGAALDPAAAARVTVENETPGLVFASATWHFSTERLPDEAEGDLLAVERRFFRRALSGGEWVLTPLETGTRLEVGDQVEVQLTIRARHPAEYVHLRDPRGAGFEPETLTSGYRWDLGIGRYEEIRDSGTNFFIEWLPAGEYTLKHRLRAATAGSFRAAPATLQSMYAPEFTAYSSGRALEVGTGD